MIAGLTSTARSSDPLLGRRWATIGLIVVGLSIAGCTSGSSGSKAGSTNTSGGGTPTSGSAIAGSPSPSATSSAPVAPGPTGGVVPTGFIPYSATYVDATHGWVLGTAPCSAEPCTSIVRTQNGTSWQGVPAPKATLGTGGSTGQLTSLRFADGLNGWAFGPALFSTHDGGATWTQTKIGDSADAEVVDVETSGGIVWAAVRGCATGAVADCAKSTTRLYRTPIEAENWVAVGSALQTAPSTIDTVIARGQQAWLNTAGSLSVTSAAGSSLTPLATPCPDDFGAGGLAVADPDHLDALCTGQGAAGSAQKQLVGSTDGGKTWRDDGPPRVTASGSYGIADNGSGVLLTADASGGSLVSRTTDDGQSFSTVLSESGSGGTAWHDLGFTTSTQAVVVLTGIAFFQSKDAGATWSKVSFTG